MPSIRNLVARENVISIKTQDDSDKRDTISLVVGVLFLVFFAIVLASCLMLLRRAKRQRMMKGGMPPAYTDVQQPGTLTIQTTDKHGRSSILVFGKDGEPMLSNPNSPPHSPDNVPEIRITFPDEQDENGRKKNGRVLVVRVGDSTVGLEPVKEELPAYEKESKTQFYSIDMDQIGGLKEKDRSTFH
jgi:hypothetical protein